MFIIFTLRFAWADSRVSKKCAEFEKKNVTFVGKFYEAKAVNSQSPFHSLKWSIIICKIYPHCEWKIFGLTCKFLCFEGGMLEAPVLTYVAEISTPKLRGILAATGSFCIILGIFSQFLMGLFLQWRTITLVSTIAPILAIFFLFFVPESPHWLILKKRDDEAKKSLMWLRGWQKTFDGVKQEFEELHKSLSIQPGNEHKESLVKAFKRRTFILPYFICSLAFFIGHFSGMTTLQTYAVPIFAQLKAPVDKYFATMLLGIVELIGTAICVLLVRFVGKRKLTFFSTFGCSFCFFSTSIYAYFIDKIPGEIPTNTIFNNVTLQVSNTLNSTDSLMKFLTTESTMNLTKEFASNLQESSNFVNETTSSIAELDTNQHSWIPLTLLLASALLSHSGIRLLPWMLIGEIFPGNIRGIASGLTGGTSYIFGFLANKLFLTMIATLTLPGTFLLYSCISAGGCVVLFILLPGKFAKISSQFVFFSNRLTLICRNWRQNFAWNRKSLQW